jgi:hypothetical protein
MKHKYANGNMFSCLEAVTSTAGLHTAVVQTLLETKLADDCVFMDIGTNLTNMPSKRPALARLLALHYAPMAHVLSEDIAVFAGVFMAAFRDKVKTMFGAQACWSLQCEQEGEVFRVRVLNYVVFTFQLPLKTIKYGDFVYQARRLKMLPFWYWYSLMKTTRSSLQGMMESLLLQSLEELVAKDSFYPAVYNDAGRKVVRIEHVNIVSTCSSNDIALGRKAQQRVKEISTKAAKTRERLEAEIVNLKRKGPVGLEGKPQTHLDVCLNVATVHMTPIAAPTVAAKPDTAIHLTTLREKLALVGRTIEGTRKCLRSMKKTGAEQKWIASAGPAKVFSCMDAIIGRVSCLREGIYTSLHNAESTPFRSGCLDSVMSCFSSEKVVSVTEDRSGAFRNMVAMIVAGNGASGQTLRRKVMGLPSSDKDMYTALDMATNLVTSDVIKSLACSGMSPEVVITQNKTTIIMGILVAAMVSGINEFYKWSVSDSTPSDFVEAHKFRLEEKAMCFTALLDCSIEHTISAVEQKAAESFQQLLTFIAGHADTQVSLNGLFLIASELRQVAAFLEELDSSLQSIGKVTTESKFVPLDIPLPSQLPSTFAHCLKLPMSKSRKK